MGYSASDGLGNVRLASWSALLSSISISGVTTVDHADIYGDYQCEAAFGEALEQAPHLRSRMEIVSKCGIATPGAR